MMAEIGFEKLNQRTLPPSSFSPSRKLSKLPPFRQWRLLVGEGENSKSHLLGGGGV